jgi:hypothetical protein
MLLISSGFPSETVMLGASAAATKGLVAELWLSAIYGTASLVSVVTEPQVRAGFTDTSGAALLDATRIGMRNCLHVGGHL